MKRNIARLSLILCLCALCVSVSTVVGTTPSAHAAAQAPQPQLLGNVKLDPYCQSLGIQSTRAGLADSTYYGWRCLNAQGSSVWVINMARACEWQYNDPSAVDQTDNFYSATSARCYRVNAFRGAPDVQGYCQSNGWRAVTVGSTAYDWRCVTPSGFLLTIGASMINVCLWQYHLGGATQMLARFANFNSTASWQCWT